MGMFLDELLSVSLALWSLHLRSFSHNGHCHHPLNVGIKVFPVIDEQGDPVSTLFC